MPYPLDLVEPIVRKHNLSSSYRSQLISILNLPGIKALILNGNLQADVLVRGSDVISEGYALQIVNKPTDLHIIISRAFARDEEDAESISLMM